MIYFNGKQRGDSCREGDFRFGKGEGMVIWRPLWGLGPQGCLAGEGKGGWELGSKK